MLPNRLQACLIDFLQSVALLYQMADFFVEISCFHPFLVFTEVATRLERGRTAEPCFVLICIRLGRTSDERRVGIELLKNGVFHLVSGAFYNAFIGDSPPQSRIHRIGGFDAHPRTENLREGRVVEVVGTSRVEHPIYCLGVLGSWRHLRCKVLPSYVSILVHIQLLK